MLAVAKSCKNARRFHFAIIDPDQREVMKMGNMQGWKMVIGPRDFSDAGKKIYERK
jgi:hypothetical protein